MKGLYIYSTNDKDYKSNGETKKVLSQVKAFEKLGVDICLLDVVLEKKIDKVRYRLPFCGVYPSSFVRMYEKKVSNVDFVYIRKNIFDGSYYSLLKITRKLNPDIKIIVEIPTYPYFQEWNRIIDKPFIIKEKMIIPKVTEEKLVDYYMTLTDDREIYGIRTIQFDNCIDVDEYKIKENKHSEEDVHLIGVALLAPWHGYDRIIKGMYEYYKRNRNNGTKVFFHIVGDGAELNYLIHLSEQCNLTNNVIFEGRKKGEELDFLFDISHIGIGSLAMFRKGVSMDRSLKSREYCARGIPFIKASSDSVFDDYQYCMSFSNDDEPIEIEKIVEWIKIIDYKQVSSSMREYAVQNLNWQKYVDRLVRVIDDDSKRRVI